jgi:WD40 repeat protein
MSLCISTLSYAQAPVLSDANPIITPENAGQVTQLAMIGRGIPRDIAYSPDGNLLAVGTSIGVWIYDVHNQALSPYLLSDINQRGFVSDIAFSPDSRFIAAGTGGEFPESGDNALIVWDVQSGAVVHHLTAHTAQIMDVAYSPDGLTIATGSADDNLHIWDAQTGEIINTLFNHRILGALALDFSPDGQFIATAHFSDNGDSFTDDTVRIRNVNTHELIHTFDGQMSALDYSPDGQSLVMGGSAIRVYDTQTGDLLHEIASERIYNYDVEFSPNGQFIAMSDANDTITIYEVATMQPVQQYRLDDTVGGVAYSPDGRTLASFNKYNMPAVQWWDIESGELAHAEKFNLWFNDALFTPDLQSIVYTQNYAVNMVAVDALKSYQPAHDEYIRFVLGSENYHQAPSPFFMDDQVMIINKRQDKIGVLDAQTGDLIRDITLTGYFYNVQYYPNRQWLTLILEGDLVVYDVNTGELIQTLSSDWDVSSFAYDADDDRIIVSFAFLLEDDYYDVRVKIYDFSAWSGNPDEAWQQVDEFPLAGIPNALSLLSTPDGRLMWYHATQDDDSLIIRDIDTAYEVELAGNGLLAPQFSPDGRLVMVESGQFILLWDSQTGELVATLRGHTDWVRAEWRADGRAILSYGEDGTIRVWGVPLP